MVGGITATCAGFCQEKSAASSEQFTVQLAAFPDAQAAQKMRDEINSTTAPVFVREDPAVPKAPYKVCLGRFSTYMDAWAVKTALPGSYPRGFIASIPTTADVSTLIGIDENSDDFPVTGVFPFESLPAQSNPLTGFTGDVASDPKEFVSVGIPEDSIALTSALTDQPTESLTRQELLVLGSKAKNNTVGTQALSRFLNENPGDPDTNAVRLRLARRLLAKEEFAKVKENLSQVKANGSAMEKRKARVITAYLAGMEKGRRAGFSAFKKLADDTNLPAKLRSHAMSRAARHAHAAHEYTTAVLAYNQIIRQSPVLKERMEARLERCAAMFELVRRGKGEWPEVIAACGALKIRAGAPEAVRMGASLMEFEAHRFANEFEKSYALGKAFLDEWGEDPKAYEQSRLRRYINTARLFQLQNAYVTGRGAEALALAANVVADPPAKNEQFSRANTFIYACVIGHLTAQENGNAQQAADFETKGREFNDSYFSMLIQSLQDIKTKHLAK